MLHQNPTYTSILFSVFLFPYPISLFFSLYFDLLQHHITTFWPGFTYSWSWWDERQNSQANAFYLFLVEKKGWRKKPCGTGMCGMQTTYIIYEGGSVFVSFVSPKPPAGLHKFEHSKTSTSVFAIYTKQIWCLCLRKYINKSHGKEIHIQYIEGFNQI